MSPKDPSAPSPTSPASELLRLRDGTQLLGRYEGSAYEQPTYLVRRDDGQVIHLSHLLYLVAELLDGERDFSTVAEALSAELDRPVVAANVEFLVEKKLRPTGLLASESDQVTPLARSLPLLALRYRKRVIPARLHRGVTTALQPLFWPPVVLLMLAALVAVNVWLFGVDRTALTQAARQLPFHPDLFLLVTVLVILSGFFHELGHATATRYGGGSPGVMGVGIYLAWPAFYTDLTDSYRLNRRGRLRSDLGGVYFNAVLVVVGGAAYLATGFGPLAVFMVVSQAMAMYQFLPFIRLDGYYIMSDLVGVPNLFAYLGPVLKSTFRRPDPVTTARLNMLKPRARLAIKVWSIVTVAFLAFNFGGIAIMAPILIPEEWASIRLQAEAMVAAFARESIALGANDLIDLIIVAVAPVGMFLIASILLRRAVRAIKRWWPTHPKVAAAFAALLAGVLLFQGQGLVGRLTASPPASGPRVMATERARQTPPGHITRSAAPSATAVPSSTALPSVSSYAAPDRIYVVQPGDTLWTIAARELGDPEQWLAIFDLNAGRPQPGGRTLVDPDLIDPGWSLELPDSQPGATVSADPSPPITTDAVVARSFPPPRQTSGVSSSAAAGPAPTSPTPPTSPAASQPSPSASRAVAPAADGTSPTGSSAEGTTGGDPTSSAQSPAPATTTQTPTDARTPTGADQSKAPGPCPRRSLTCQSPPGAAAPQASPPPSMSRGDPPPTLPPLSPAGRSKRAGNPADEQVGGAVVSGQAATGMPAERGPPDAEGD